jgi:transposase InsO family protein
MMLALDSKSKDLTLSNPHYLSNPHDYHNRNEARVEIFESVELFYNRKLIHQSLDYQTPMKYEAVKLSLN